MGFEGFPLVVGIELTLACNLRCRHCASSAGNPRANELSLEEVLTICDQFPALLVQEVDFTGGEPLLREDWPVIAAHLRNLGIPIRMVSNGYLLEENVEPMVRAGIDTVGVSFDGNQTTHDAIRNKPGLFLKVIKGVCAAVEAGIPVAAITAVNDGNVHQLAELYKVLKAVGIRHWQIQPTFRLGRALKDNLTLSTDSFMKMGLFIKDNIAAMQDDGFLITIADGVGYYTDLDQRREPWKGCCAGLASCGITSDGKVKPCLSMPDHLVEGDLRLNDFWHIWFDSEAFAFNRHFTRDQLGDSCRVCSYGEQCKGGCAVMSYAYTKQFHNNPYCFHNILEFRETLRNNVDSIRGGLCRRC